MVRIMAYFQLYCLSVKLVYINLYSPFNMVETFHLPFDGE